MTPTIEDFASKMDLIVHSPTGPMISDQPFTTSGKTIFQYFYDRNELVKLKKKPRKANKTLQSLARFLLPYCLKENLSYFSVFGLSFAMLDFEVLDWMIFMAVVPLYYCSKL